MWKIQGNLGVVWRILKLQVIVGIICAGLVFVITHSRNSFISSICGSLLAIIPATIYAIIAFRRGAVNYPRDALQQHKKAITFRFLTTAILFTLVCYYFRQCNFLLLFAVYIISLSAYWLSLVI